MNLLKKLESFDFKRYLKEFKIQSKLGQGGFGTVYLAQHFITKELVAIKKIPISEKIVADKVGEVFNEAKSL